MRAEHEIGTKSCRNWHKIVMCAEYEKLNRGLKIVMASRESYETWIRNRDDVTKS